MDWKNQEQKAKYLGFPSVAAMEQALGYYEFISTGETIISFEKSEVEIKSSSLKLDPWISSPTNSMARGCISYFGTPAKWNNIYGGFDNWAVCVYYYDKSMWIYKIKTPNPKKDSTIWVWGEAYTKDVAIKKATIKAIELGWEW